MFGSVWINLQKVTRHFSPRQSGLYPRLPADPQRPRKRLALGEILWQVLRRTGIHWMHCAHCVIINDSMTPLGKLYTPCFICSDEKEANFCILGKIVVVIYKALERQWITPKLNTETKSEWSTPIYQHVSTPEFTWLQVRIDLSQIFM